jgi:transcriptional regulator with XRE-family HTH domain
LLQQLLGRRVRDLRMARRMTQHQLSQRSALSSRFIGAIERGDGNPSLEAIGRISVALGLRIDELLSFEETLSTAAAERAVRRQLALEQLFAYVSPLPADRLERALRLLRAAMDSDSPCDEETPDDDPVGTA